MVDDVVTPFGYGQGEGIHAGVGEHHWICEKNRVNTDPMFEKLNPIDGKISGAGKQGFCPYKVGRNLLKPVFNAISAAKSELIKSKLPNSVLSKVWKLSDVDNDGFLDVEEFALAMHLINIKLDGNELPTALPDHLVPPSKRLYE